jgi:hypothetical protein
MKNYLERTYKKAPFFACEKVIKYVIFVYIRSDLSKIETNFYLMETIFFYTKTLKEIIHFYLF